MQLAALPMYDFGALRAANDALWASLAAHLRDRGIDAPAALTRDRDLPALWADPRLLLAQTCGYPLMTTLRGRVTVVATPIYDAPGCTGLAYRSALVVRRDDPAGGLADLRGRRCTVNTADSNSGMNLLRHAVSGLAAPVSGFFGAVTVTGGHLASARAVAEGEADLAAIDCVTWAHLNRLDPGRTQGLRVIGWTEATAGLPLITAGHTSAGTVRALRAGLRHVAADPALAPARATLLVKGFAVPAPDAYDGVLELERQALARGCDLLGGGSADQ